MGSTVFPAASTTPTPLPIGATGTVASGYASTGGWKYSTSTAAGTYQVVVQAPSDRLYGVETANNVAVNGLQGGDVAPLKLGSTEASITFGSYGPFKIQPVTSTNGSIISYGGGNGLFVIGTTTGYLYTSTNGVTWTNRTSGIEGGSGVIYGNATYHNDRWIVPQIANSAGSAGYALYSTDGVTWSILNVSSQNGGNWVMFVYYANGIWVLGSQVGSTTQSILTSTNFSTWTSRTAPNALRQPRSIAYGPWRPGGTSYFIMGTTAGYIWYSTDGTSWTETNIAAALGEVGSVVYNPVTRNWLLTGGGGGSTTGQNYSYVSRTNSSTPTSWQTSSMGNTYIFPNSSQSYASCAYGLFIIFSNATTEAASQTLPGVFKYAISADGWTWTVKSAPYNIFIGNNSGGATQTQINGILGYAVNYYFIATTATNDAAFYLNSTALTTLN